MKKIAVLTGTRAEYGLLKPVISRIKQDEELKLCLIVTGAHLEKQYGETKREIEQDGFPITYEVRMNLQSDSSRGILKSMALELDGLADVFEKEQPDLLVLLGDRYEIMMAAMCALINRVPIAHIHGGELTEGAVDDGIRHAVTKLSSIHFTSTEEYRNRVIQMGENPALVYNVGALGVENVADISYLSKKELTDRFDIDWQKPIVMVTYHPVTLEENSSGEQFYNLLQVLDKHKEYSYVFTYANADMDGQAINHMIEEFVAEHQDCRVFASMGQVGYLSMLNYAVAVVGNSSSGIIEAPSFHIPTINIGNRQRGRARAKTVIDCGTSRKEIEKALASAMSKEFRDCCKDALNPYQGEHTSANIVRHMKEYLETFESTKKTFYDITIDKQKDEGK